MESGTYKKSNETEKDDIADSGYIEGRNPVREALKAGTEIDKIIYLKGNTEGSLRQIIGIAKEKGIVVQAVEKQKLDRISNGDLHQGIIAYIAARKYVDVDYILNVAEQKKEPPFIVILDDINDPHNLGSIIRTVECCGAHGVIIPKRRSVGLTPVVAKTSSGAIEYVPVAKVTNVASTIDYLKEKGLWIAGAAIEGKKYYDSDLKGPIALVIGNEGHGIRKLVKEKCDFLVSVPLKGKIESLNASVAAAILIAEVERQRDLSLT